MKKKINHQENATRNTPQDKDRDRGRTVGVCRPNLHPAVAHQWPQRTLENTRK